MASISANGSKGHHTFTLNVWENSTNTQNNTSNVGWSLVLSPIQAYWDWNISGIYWNVTINGVGYSGSIQSYDGVSTVTIASSSLDIAHNNDGNKTIGFSFSINDTRNMSYTPGSCSASGSMNLTYIPRQAIITSASDFTDEDNPTIQFSNPGGYSMEVWLEPNPAGTHYATRTNIPNTGSYTWELTNEERTQLRQACTGNSCIVRLGILTTISGSQYASYVDKTMTIINGNPVFENFTYEDTNSTITAVTGNNQVLVKGVSTLQATISVANKMEAVKEATEKNYVATIDIINQSANYDDDEDIVFNLGTISTAGAQRLNIRAYDSRNNSTLVYKDITVYDYEKPVVNFTAERLNNFEAQTNLTVSGSFSSLIINNVEKNTIQSVQYRYREIGASTWGSWNNLTFTINNNEFTCTNTAVSLDNTKEFEIEVKATDNLNNNSSIQTIDVGVPIFFISSNLENAYVGENRVLTEADEESLKLKMYDDTERVVGTYFGKPLYAKTIYISSFPNATVQNYATGISNLKFAINIYGYAQETTGSNFVINIARPDNPQNAIGAWIDAGQLRITAGSDRSAYSGYITIEYTKTTD